MLKSFLLIVDRNEVIFRRNTTPQLTARKNISKLRKTAGTLWKYMLKFRSRYADKHRAGMRQSCLTVSRMEGFASKFVATFPRLLSRILTVRAVGRKFSKHCRQSFQVIWFPLEISSCTSLYEYRMYSLHWISTLYVRSLYIEFLHSYLSLLTFETICLSNSQSTERYKDLDILHVPV